MRNISGRILFILIVLLSLALKLKETQLSLYKDSFIHVHLKGYLPYEQSVELLKGSSYEDLLNNAELYSDSESFMYSIDYPLYDNQTIEFLKKDTQTVNINTADKTELVTLPGIGEKTAEKIIEYRNITPFKCREDLMKVNGIGEKKYELLKELISV